MSGGGYTFVMHSFGELPAWLTGSNLMMCYTVAMSGVRGKPSCSGNCGYCNWGYYNWGLLGLAYARRSSAQCLQR